MTFDLTIRHNFKEIRAAMDKLPEEVMRKATVSALNKTMAQGQTQVIREIARQFNLTTAKIRERLRIDRATMQPGRVVLAVALVGTGKRSLNLIAFVEKSVTLAQARKRMKLGEGGRYKLRNGGTVSKAFELRFKIKRDAPAKVIPGAFIANKGRTVFQRVGKERLPIKGLTTIDVPSMFNTKRVNAALVDFLTSKFPAVWEHEAEFYLSKFNDAKAGT